MRFVRSSLYSCIFILIGVLGGYLFSHGKVEMLWVPGEWIVVFFGVLGITTLTYGWRATIRAIRSIGVLLKDDVSEYVNTSNRDILRYMAERSYIMGMCGACLGVIITMGFIAADKATIGIMMGHCMVGYLSGVLLAEVVLLPASTRINHLLKNEETPQKVSMIHWSVVGVGGVIVGLFLVLWLTSYDAPVRNVGRDYHTNQATDWEHQKEPIRKEETDVSNSYYEVRFYQGEEHILTQEMYHSEVMRQIIFCNEKIMFYMDRSNNCGRNLVFGTNDDSYPVLFKVISEMDEKILHAFLIEKNGRMKPITKPEYDAYLAARKTGAKIITKQE